MKPPDVLTETADSKQDFMMQNNVFKIQITVNDVEIETVKILTKSIDGRLLKVVDYHRAKK